MGGTGTQSSGIVSRLASWAAQPFTQSIDLGSVLLVTTLILITVFFWTRILNDIVEVE